MTAFLDTVRGGFSRDAVHGGGAQELELAVDTAAERIGSGLVTGARIDGISLAALAAQETGADIHALILGSIDAWAAGYFADGTTAWSAAPAGACPWQSYRACAAIDPSAELLGVPRVRAHFAALPGGATRVLASAARELGWEAASVERAFRGLWGDVARWEARACAAGWVARTRGRDNAAARQLLAVRVSWELVLHRALQPGRTAADEAAEVWYA